MSMANGGSYSCSFFSSADFAQLHKSTIMSDVTAVVENSWGRKVPQYDGDHPKQETHTSHLHVNDGLELNRSEEVKESGMP